MASAHSRVRYDPVEDDDKTEESNDDYSQGLLHDRALKIRRSRRQKITAILYIVLFVSLCFNVVALIVFLKPFQGSLLEQQRKCGKLLGQWLPEMENGVEYELRTFRGSFGHKNDFTGVGPAVDAAWDNITESPTGGAISITKEQWEAVNPFHDNAVMLNEDHPTGRYLASLDVFHQLHCVDLLRKSLHREYYNHHEGSFAGSPEDVVQSHLEHCVETIRQTIMCHGDVSVLTYNWVKGREMPYPNFNTIHMCKKWDNLVAWNRKRDVTSEWVQGVGVKQLAIPDKPPGVEGMWPPP